MKSKTICGVDIKGKEFRLALVTFSDGEYKYEPVRPMKISVSDPEDARKIKQALQLIETYATDNKVDIFAVKKRGARGSMAAGGDTFRLEAILQIQSKAEFELVTAQKIAKAKKGNSAGAPSELNSYQEDAYIAAICSGLRDD